MRPSDHAARSLPELHRAVVRGESGGEIIWQPRIGCWLEDKRFAGERLPEPFEGMSLADIYRELGCSARLYEFNACFRRVEDARVRTTDRRLKRTDTETVTETPVGRQVAVRRRTASSPNTIRVKWPIESKDELRVATWRAERASWRWDGEAYARLAAEVGDLGLPTVFMPRVTVQDLYIDTMGVERAVYALHDWPDAVRAYFRALDDLHERLIDVVNPSPVEVVNFGDNVHCGTLPPALFREHVLPSYRRRVERLHAAGRFVHAHWDGDVKALLPFARETGLDGIEAITPAPQGDVALEEVRDALGDAMFLIDGIPAIYFDATFPVEALEECARKVIDLFAPRLVLGISDEISSTGDIERVRLVGRIVDDYNAPSRAVADVSIAG